MVSESPPFWWTKIGWQALLLSPATLIYGAIAGRNMRRARRAPVDCPVICVGNFTVGGAGKTPTAIAIARAAVELGYKPGLLSRGYSGMISKPTIVDPHHHRAVDVGDEPLLLARAGLTAVARNRLEGARKLIAEGADLIIMDDGFQSARIAIDYALVVVDGKRGIGNGLVVPSGPVRAPLKEQLRHVTTLLAVSGGAAADPFIRRMSRAGKPVLEAAVGPVNGTEFAGKRVFAFAGIADPTKFYKSLADAGRRSWRRGRFRITITLQRMKSDRFVSMRSAMVCCSSLLRRIACACQAIMARWTNSSSASMFWISRCASTIRQHPVSSSNRPLRISTSANSR